jgi:hypothetical protein
MTDLIDTTAGFWLPEATEDAFDVYFKSFEASGSVGTLSDDTSSYSTLGYTYHDIFEIHEDNIILEEAYIKFAFWEIGCSGQGSTFDSYIVIDGPTYDSIPFTAYCGNFTKIDLDVTLQQGDYVVRVKKNSNVYNWEDNYTHLAGSVTQKTGLTSEYKMLAKVKFGRTNSCLPGRLHAKGKFCDFTSVEDVNKQALVIYPNPTTGIVNFSTVAESVEVFSIEGRMVGQFNNTETINLSKLNRGTYLIKADGKVATVVVK